MSIASVSVPVPLSGDGAAVSIATLVGAKTVILTGLFKGRYTILAAHQAGALVPVLQFDAGGEAGIEQTLPDAYQFVAVRTNVNTAPLGGGSVTVTINGVVGVGQNKFASLATLNVGASGPQTSIDTYALFPPTGVEEGISILCEGTFEGNIIIEGSEDNSNWNPIGQFSATTESPALLNTSRLLEFAPLPTEDLVRYVRVNVDGTILGLTKVTIGGRIPASVAPVAGGSLEVESSLGKTTTLNAAGEEILYEEPINLAVFTNPTLTPTLSGVLINSAPSTGTFRAYIGSVTPGVTGTLVATITSAAVFAQALVSASGAAVANPGTVVLLQITGQNSAPATAVSKIYSFNLTLS